MGKKGCNLLMKPSPTTSYQVNGKGAFKEEFVTCGGISLSNIDLHTLEARCALTSSLPAKCSTSMPSPAASICRLPGPRDMWWDNT